MSALTPAQRRTRITRKAGRLARLAEELEGARGELDRELAEAYGAGAPIPQLIKASGLHRNTVVKAIARTGVDVNWKSRWE